MGKGKNFFHTNQKARRFSSENLRAFINEHSFTRQNQTKLKSLSTLYHKFL